MIVADIIYVWGPTSCNRMVLGQTWCPSFPWMKMAFLGLISQNMHISCTFVTCFKSGIDPSSLSSEVSIVLLPELQLDLQLSSWEIDLLSFVKSRLSGFPSAATSVSINSRLSISCEPIPESWEDIVSDLGRSVSPSTVVLPSVSSMPSGTTTILTCCCLLVPFLFLLGLSGAHCFRLSQQRVQCVISWLGVLQL